MKVEPLIFKDAEVDWYDYKVVSEARVDCIIYTILYHADKKHKYVATFSSCKICECYFEVGVYKTLENAKVGCQRDWDKFILSFIKKNSKK